MYTKKQFTAGRFAAIVMCFALPLSAGMAGCSDHRITLNEFLETQRPAPPAETTESQQAVGVMVDKAMGPYRVGPGDVLVVTQYAADPAGAMPPVTARIDRNGQIDLPMVGTLKVAGMELEDVERAIQKAYVPKFLHEAIVHVEVNGARATNVLVIGAVERPGLVPLRRTERDLLHAIVAVGGVSNLASGHVTLRRVRGGADQKTVTANLTDPEDLKKALAMAPLEDGDIVTVHAAAPNTIFVGGLVSAPRPQVYPPGVEISILQAIAASGGLRTDLTPREATLVHRMPNGKDVHVKLDLDRITTGKDPNITLAAGDILWVPHTIETRVQEWINRNVFFRAGMSVTYSLEGTEDFLHADRGGAAGRTLQDTFDPFGTLLRNQVLQTLSTPAP